MSKRAKILATYRTNEGEVFQVAASAPASFPDVLDECRAQAVRGVRELLAEALATRYTSTD